MDCYSLRAKQALREDLPKYGDASSRGLLASCAYRTTSHSTYISEVVSINGEACDLDGWNL